jgi:plastocyanin domain-containing protein
MDGTMALHLGAKGLVTAAALALAGVGVACREGGSGGEVAVTVGRNGFEPWRIPARKGTQLVLVVTRTSEETCATELVIPEAGVNVPLPLGKAVRVVLTPGRTGELRFSCAMRMFGGVIDVR